MSRVKMKASGSSDRNNGVGFVQVVGCDTSDSTPTVFVFFNQDRYLFNCGEGTQRMSTEHPMRIKRLTKIFLTRISWERIGGLPGMLLTLSDAGIADAGPLSISGPTGTIDMVKATRYYIYRPGMYLDAMDMGHDEEDHGTPALMAAPVDDGVLRVQPVLLAPAEHLERMRGLASRSELIRAIPKKRKRSVDDQEDDAVDAEGQPKRQHTAMDVGGADADADADADGDVGGAVVAMDVEAPVVAGAQGGAGDAEAEDEDEEEAHGIGFDHPETPALPGAVHFPSSQDTRELVHCPVVACYVCTSASERGKFNARRARELGVRPGPLFGVLQSGGEVTLDDGRVVTSDMVMGAEVPGATFVVVECPDAGYLESLVGHPGFATAHATASLVVHLTPPEVLTSGPYVEWMHRFADTTEHLLVNAAHGGRPLVFHSATKALVARRRFSASLFPAPCRVPVPDPALLAAVFDGALPARTRGAAPFVSFQVRPVARMGFREDMTLAAFDEAAPVRHVEQLLGLDACSDTGLPVEGAWIDANEPFEVTFLGTGSAIPCKHRNVSGTYVQVNDGARVEDAWGFLLDAGEGSLGQLYRRYGTRLDDVLRGLRVLFISHIHADHHLGAIRILEQRAALSAEDGGALPPVVVVAPSNYTGWLSEIEALLGVDFNILVLDMQMLRAGAASDAPAHPLEVLCPALASLFSAVVAVPVDHCALSVAVVITHPSGWRIVFSGDCRPSERLARIGKGATVLIHEATFGDDLAHEAVAKKHATTSEAVGVGRDMQAQIILLNHFSQRYPSLPDIDLEQADPEAPIVCMAFDLMSVNPSNAHLFSDVVQQLREVARRQEEGA